MANILEDRIQETSTTTGTGAFALAGAVTGFRAFSAVCSIADTAPYFIEGVDGSGVPTGEFETGLGTYSAASTLTRTTVLRSSNGNAAVAFSAGTKRVAIGLLASNVTFGTVTSVAVSGGTTGLTTTGGPVTGAGTITLAGTLAVANGGTGANTLTGYTKGNGTGAFTASATIPNTDITGLGTMSTQAASAVAITGGTMDGIVIGGTTPDAGTFTNVTTNGLAATALHRSPNAITALFVYDTAKDSDGGAWRKRMAGKSWMTEPLNGKWLGAYATLAAAWAVAGAVAGNYFQLTTNGKFYALTGTTTSAETFRGNKAEFPALSAIVAEATSVTIYDLTEPGRPMWMRFVYSIYNWMRQSAATSLVARDSALVVVGSLGAVTISFAAEYSEIRATGVYRMLGTMAQRNAGVGISAAFGTGIVNNFVYAVSMTVLPDAPIDAATGLPIPTIAVATAGGISIIQNTGTVRNSASGVAATKIAITPDALFWLNSAGALWAPYPGVLGAAFAATTYNISTAPAQLALPTQLATGRTKAMGSASGVTLLRDNASAQGLGAVATISSTFSTGWQTGDIRRALLSSNISESITGGTDPDRSYKNKPISIFGTLTKSPVATGSELVAYSGFSAVNYLQEPYSADLDFGTGAWSVEAWVNAPARKNLLTKSEQFNDAAWGKTNATVTFPTGTTALVIPNAGTRALTQDGLWQSVTIAQGLTYTITANFKANGLGFAVIGISNRSGFTATATFNLSTGAVASLGAHPDAASTLSGAMVQVSSGVWRCSFSFLYLLELNTIHLTGSTVAGSSVYSSFITGDGANGVIVSYPQVETGPTATTYQRVNTATDYDGSQLGTAIARNSASGPSIAIGVSATTLQATAFDGTTTRTVTSPASYNTATWNKVSTIYSVNGDLALRVNGVQVAVATGAPLLTLTNAAAVLTVGNSFALDAPFQGSLALVNIGATVSTPEAFPWMYAQEQAMFAPGAQVCLPGSGAILDLAYDDLEDKFRVISGTNQSSFVGLVRTTVLPVSAGTYTKIDGKGGVMLTSRITTTPGVDIQMPAYGLREELVRRAEAAAAQSKVLTVFDFDVVGFTASTANGSPTLASVASVAGVPYVGMGITGTGIPANTTILAISGSTYTMSANATATGTGVAIGQNTFTLPSGWTATGVASAGANRREGASKDWARLFDGFRETVRFAVSPGSAVWLQITGRKS